MEQRQTALGTARLIATLIYVGPLVIFPWVTRMAKIPTPPSAKVMGVLVPALRFVAVTDYVISLFIEARLLRQARHLRAPQSLVSAAVVTASFGASLAVYGLIVTMLGAPVWGAVFYVLCAAHGLHLMMRWPAYQQVVEDTGSNS